MIGWNGGDRIPAGLHPFFQRDRLAGALILQDKGTIEGAKALGTVGVADRSGRHGGPACPHGVRQHGRIACPLKQQAQHSGEVAEVERPVGVGERDGSGGVPAYLHRFS
jgi:hypothetical protein